MKIKALLLLKKIMYTFFPYLGLNFKVMFFFLEI